MDTWIELRHSSSKVCKPMHLHFEVKMGLAGYRLPHFRGAYSSGNIFSWISNRVSSQVDKRHFVGKSQPQLQGHRTHCL
jgi:hypothetical protein